MKGLVGGDGELHARNVGHCRPASGGDQDELRRVPLRADIDRVGIDHDGTPVLDAHPRARQQTLVNAVQSFDLRVLVGHEGGPFEGAGPQSPAVAGLGLLEVLPEVGGVHEQLLRDAPDVHAGTSQVALFDHDRSGTETRGDPARPHPAGAGTDDEEIVVVVGHDDFPTTRAGLAGRCHLRPAGPLWKPSPDYSRRSVARRCRFVL
jgi:hypothetical protein